ncbi:dipeptidyl peptidase 3-like [Paramacrobiotus metropolitanus]|uniref:dipeptidyl peptidase 3-like n=1 Tax=Paramacrobiotus metropolitanus TaxID=2943436 RepID=UPI0024456177|nr:dipeptidyl peptidase 3-like [Paramacrobiotus metropolitanus]
MLPKAIFMMDIMFFSRLILFTAICSDYVLSQNINNASVGIPANNTMPSFNGVPPEVDLRQHSIVTDTPIAFIQSQSAFDTLSPTEKLYVHHFSRASWLGGLIDLYQTSVESPYIFLLLQQIFRTENVEDYARKKCDFSPGDWDALQKYAAGVYHNLGNYHSYGMRKFIPLVSQTKVECLVQTLVLSTPTNASFVTLTSLWNNAGALMYNMASRYRLNALKPAGITTYFSANCDEKDAKLVQEYMSARNIEGWNNRVIKTDAGNGRVLYEIRFASVYTSNDTLDGLRLGFVEDFENSSFFLTRGDFSELLIRTNVELMEASRYASNVLEQQIINATIESFTTGSINAHKRASQSWVLNKMPALESYIGFIETYQDPSGQRASFEGFVAVVDKVKSARLANLVAHAEEFLPLLPWKKEFEKDKFMKPDFTDLNVVAFANGGVPAGINLPNYNEIRQNDGFKNVNLGNVIAATYASKKVQFLSPEDAASVKQNILGILDIIVGLHELLGHGSGKLFMEFPNGTFNANASVIGHMQIGDFGSINNWYKPGQTYESVFGKLASTMEECRAESVAVHLSLFPDVLSIWNINQSDAERWAHLVWLDEASQGLVSLAEYDPLSDTWGEAHAQGHFAILRVMQEAGVANISVTTGEDGRPDLLVTIDRSKLYTAGRAAIGHFLLGLQYYRSTGNVTGAQIFYDRYTTMKGGDSPALMQWHRISIDRKQPRSLIVEPNTVIGSPGQQANVVLKNYDANADGMLQSFRDRFSDLKLEEELFAIANRDRHHYVV